MKIRLKLMGMFEFISPFKDERETEVDLVDASIEELINHVVSKMKLEDKNMLINERGEIQSDLVILRNKEFITVPDQLGQPLAEGDFVELALSGT